MNQTAHISLQLSINVKEQHSEAKNKTDAPVFPSAPACQIYQSAPVSPERPAVSPARLPSFQASRRLSAAFPVPSCVPAVPSGVSQQHLVAAGEGGSKVTPNNPQAKKQQKPNFPKRKDTNKTKSMTYMPKKVSNPDPDAATANTAEHPKRPATQLTHRTTPLIHNPTARNHRKSPRKETSHPARNHAKPDKKSPTARKNGRPSPRQNERRRKTAAETDQNKKGRPIRPPFIICKTSDLI